MDGIRAYIPGLTLTREQEQVLGRLDLFQSNEFQIFLLKGYAGTGKTTLIKGLVAWLSAEKKEFMVMAPTGRAAKVLRDKTGGHGATIHRSIYNLERMESVNSDEEDVAEHSVHFHFPIMLSDHTEKIFIVDEASMVSNTELKHDLFTFGTNRLLDDLLTFSRISTTHGSKIIFVGDPAQLPPIGDPDPLALDATFFAERGLKVEEFTLTEVVRQKESAILRNSGTIRGRIDDPTGGFLALEYDETSFRRLPAELVATTYTSLFPHPDPEEGVVIGFTNAQAYWTNTAIRKILHPGIREVIPGDLLLVNHNNYGAFSIEFFNGDIVKVAEVSPSTISRTAPVMVDEGGRRIRRNITLEFRKVKVRAPGYAQEAEVMIIDSLLHSIDRDLSIPEMKMLYIQFVMRWRDQQQARKKSGLPYFKEGSEQFRQALKEDPFYNALRVKFGYAITCHKAQGGEWSRVIVDYAGQVRMNKNALRWCYTATTRGVDTVYAVNAPHFGPMSRFTVSEIGPLGKVLPADALNFDLVLVSPLHATTLPRCTSFKYWEILSALEGTGWEIASVESFPFRERYMVTRDGETVVLDGTYSGSGHFRQGFRANVPVKDPIHHELETLFNSRSGLPTPSAYVPSMESLERLHSLMLSACAELEITITNIVEHTANYYVIYYLQTDALCAYVQFYFDGRGVLTRAIPKTFECPRDLKLEHLLEKLKDHAYQ